MKSTYSNISIILIFALCGFLSDALPVENDASTSLTDPEDDDYNEVVDAPPYKRARFYDYDFDTILSSYWDEPLSSWSEEDSDESFSDPELYAESDFDAILLSHIGGQKMMDTLEEVRPDSYSFTNVYFGEAISSIADSMLFILFSQNTKTFLKKVWARAEDYSVSHPQSTLNDLSTISIDKVCDAIAQGLMDLKINDDHEMDNNNNRLLQTLSIVSQSFSMLQDISAPILIGRRPPTFREIFLKMIEFGSLCFAENPQQRITKQLKEFSTTEIGEYSFDVEVDTRMNLRLPVLNIAKALFQMFNTALIENVAFQIIHIAAVRAETNGDDINPPRHAFLIREGYKLMKELSERVPLLIHYQYAISDDFNHIVQSAIEISKPQAPDELLSLMKFVDSTSGDYAFDKKEMVKALSERFSCQEVELAQLFLLEFLRLLDYEIKKNTGLLSTSVAEYSGDIINKGIAGESSSHTIHAAANQATDNIDFSRRTSIPLIDSIEYW